MNKLFFLLVFVPVVLFSQETTVFSDDFSNASENWELKIKNDDFTTQVADGVLKINNTSKSRKWVNTMINLDGYKNYKISYKVKKVSGDKNAIDFWFDMTENKKSAQCFIIDNNGFWSYEHLRNNIWIQGTSWQKTATIIKDGWNEVVIYNYNTKLYFTINGKLVFVKTAELAKENRIGFGNKGSQIAYVDELRIEYIDTFNANLLKDESFLEEGIEKTVIKETFDSNTNGWFLTSKPNYNTTIVNKELQITNNTANSGVKSYPKKGFNSSLDLDIKFKTKYLSGNDDKPICFEFWSEKKQIRFGFTENKQWFFNIFKDKKWQAKDQYIKTQFIKSNDYNDIHIQKVKNQLFFSINGKIIHTYVLSNIWGWNIGKFYNFTVDAGVTATYDNLTITEVFRSRKQHDELLQSLNDTYKKHQALDGQSTFSNESLTNASGKKKNIQINAALLFDKYDEFDGIYRDVAKTPMHKIWKLSGQNKLRANGKSLKNNKTYESIQFKFNNEEYYTSGKTYSKKEWLYGKKYGNVKYVKTDSPIYYADTKTMYTANLSDENGILQPKNNTWSYYHKNGQLKYRLYVPNDCNESQHLEYFLSDGSKELDIYFENCGNDKGKRIAENAPKPSKIQFLNGGVYTGYRHVGTYTNPDGFKITGFLTPSKFKIGNGTVVFVESPYGDYYWALIVNNQIRAKIPSELKEKPDVAQLNEIIHNTKTDGYNIKIAPNFTGYGMEIISDVANPKHTNVKVGFFENGTLSGLGFEADTEVIDKKTKTYSGILLTVNAAFGTFGNGELVDGNVIDVKKLNPKTINFWRSTPYEGLDWYNDTARTLFEIKDAELPFASLSKKIGKKFYIENIKRYFNLESVHTVNKSLRFVNPYEPTEKFVVPYKATNIYLYSKERNTNYNTTTHKRCKGTGFVQETVWETYYEDRQYKTGTMWVKTPGGNYARGTKTYTYQVPRQREAGYRKVTCAACNGTGKYTKSSTQMENYHQKVTW